MNRWLVVLLVVLALIILISPGIVGRLAEQNIEDGIAWTEADSPGVTITTEDFQRGWFTSEGRHRVVLEGGQFRDVSEQYAAATGNAELPSLIIDTRMDHGLLPVTSLSRDEGSLAPGLANTVSTFSVDPGNGVPVKVPGALYSKVGLSGASDARLLLEPSSFEYDGATVAWQGTDLLVSSDPGSKSRAVSGTIKAVNFKLEGVDAGIESVVIDADQTATDYGFNVGDVAIALSALTMDDDGQRVSMAGMKIHGTSEINAARLSGTSNLQIDQLTLPTGDVVDLDLQFSMADMDASSLGVIVKALQDAQGADDPEAALAAVFPTIEGDVQTLLRRGLNVNIDQLEVSLPQGILSTTMKINVAETDDDDTFSWPGVLLNMTAAVDISVPAELYDLAIMMNPEANMLVAMGFLKKDGDYYVMDAAYEKGLVNVNGAPMPLPIPGM